MKNESPMIISIDSGKTFDKIQHAENTKQYRDGRSILQHNQYI